MFLYIVWIAIPKGSTDAALCFQHSCLPYELLIRETAKSRYGRSSSAVGAHPHVTALGTVPWLTFTVQTCVAVPMSASVADCSLLRIQHVVVLLYLKPDCAFYACCESHHYGGKLPDSARHVTGGTVLRCPALGEVSERVCYICGVNNHGN